MGQPAKVLGPADVRRLLSHTRHQRHPARNRVMILLSFKAGLRACEIAGLTWSMVLRPNGRLASSIHVSRDIAKNGSGRTIPLNPELATALRQLLATVNNDEECHAVVRSERGDNMTASAVVNWFGRVYRELGMDGCSSHSGRRTFITRSARLLPKIGGSLRDVQELAGHRSLTTTERYIEGDRDVQRKLLRML